MEFHVFFYLFMSVVYFFQKAKIFFDTIQYNRLGTRQILPVAPTNVFVRVKEDKNKIVGMVGSKGSE